MIIKAARKALRKSRQQAGGSYVEILREGEKAAKAGLPLSANPYKGEDAEIWAEGYEDGKGEG